jgi:glycosyltransferase involved in cell wall biosynthesis
VATDIDGVREEIRHNETGLLVSPADPMALADAILTLLEDREKAERLGLEARREAEQRFDLKHTFADVEKLYEEVLNRKSERIPRSLSEQSGDPAPRGCGVSERI